MEFKFGPTIIGDPANIMSVNKLVATFCISYKRAPDDLRIEVFQTGNSSFYANSNYSIWSLNQAESYFNSHGGNTVKEALTDALENFLAFDDPSTPDDVLFWESSDGVLYDGKGEKISLSEATKRRSDYREK
jgi:hypothetical protein